MLTKDEILAEYKSHYAQGTGTPEFRAGAARREELRAMLGEDEWVELLGWVMHQIWGEAAEDFLVPSKGNA